MSSDFDSALAQLRQALATMAPPTSPALDPNGYPGLRITQAPAAATELDAFVAAAFEAAGWPSSDDPIPRAIDLTPTQRALAEVVAEHPGVPLGRWAIPQTRWARRRWLGLESGSVVNREVEYTIGDQTLRAPMWRALDDLDGDEHWDEEQAKRLFEALPLSDRLEAFGELMFDAYFVEPPSGIDEPLGDAGATWAPAYADRLLELFAPEAPHTERNGFVRPPREITRLVARALVEAEIPIEERWDILIPLDLVWAADLPRDRRDQVIVRELQDAFPRNAIHAGLEHLRRSPSRPILEHLLERADQCIRSLACPPRRQLAAELREAVLEHPELVAAVDAYVDALPPLPELHCTRKLYLSSVDQLAEGQKKQLAILGEGWETADGPIAWKDEDGQTRFGTIKYVSAYEIADAAGNPAFEALLYLDEDGAVCRAGTLNSVAYISQTSLSWNIDEPTIEALHAILRERPARS